ncbi:TolC family protein [Brevundimonas aurantiaca]|uniref:TolC family protein n=1 Tax=Brevundimonas aurantiaca TaxID=74316 RepID=UPI001CD53C64|nr:TolC family protein [Brevundimonas aurantiaca]
MTHVEPHLADRARRRAAPRRPRGEPDRPAHASGPALADPLTFDQALTRAESAPDLRASDLEVAAARSGADAAGRLPDPELTFGVDNFPVSGPMAGRFGDDEMTMARIGLMQSVPSGERRRAERAVADADIGVAEAGRASPGATSASRRGWPGSTCTTPTASAARSKRSWRPWSRCGRPPRRRRLGRRPAGDGAGARPPQGRPGRSTRGPAGRRGQARAEVTRWTDDPAPTTAGTPPHVEVDPATLRAALDRLPMLQAYAAAGTRADADVAMAQAGQRPDWAFEVEYGRRDPMFGDMVSVGARVRLPLFADQRQAPVIAARSADAARVRVEREAALRTLRAQLESDLADHVMHHDQWLRARDVVLPDALRRADLETASYGAGRAGIGEVLEAFTAVADARLEALDREAAVARDAVRLTLIYGSADQ